MVYIILGKGFEEIEAIAPCDILRRGGVPVSFAGVESGKIVEGAHGISVATDIAVSDISPAKEDCFVIPGGMGGVNSIKADKTAMSLIKKAADIGCNLAAICAGPSVLASLGILEGRHITCYPGCEDMMGGAVCKTTHPSFADGNLITGRAPAAALDFGLALLAHLAGGDITEEVRRSLVY